MAILNGSWSLSTTDNVTTASFIPENSSTATITISGFSSSSVTQESLSSVIIVDDSGTVSLKSGALSGLADGASLTLGEGYPQYSLKLDSSDSTIADKPKIDTTDNTPFTVTATSGNANNATLKGKLTAYYEPSEDGKTITYHQAAENTTLATITGLTSVDSIAFDSATKTNIQLKLANLSNSKTGVSISPVTIANLDTSGSNIDPANFKFTFVANGTSGDNGNTVNTTNGTLGFTSDGNTFKTVAGDNKAVTYNAKTMEGWTLSTDGKSITYTAADDTKVLATITGLGYDVDTANVGASSVKVKPNTGSAEGITVSGSVITINKAALGSTTVTLNNETGSNYTLAFKTDEAITIDGNYKGKVGFDNYDTSTKYWQATDGTATYKYTIGEGWELNGTTKITHSGASTTELITLTGLKVNDITNNTTTAITGVNFGMAGASTGIDTSTIYISSGVFDTTTEGSVVSLTKSGTVGSNTYSKLALDASETTLKTALTVNTDPDLKLSTTITGSNATITGDTFEWYEIPTGDSPTTITYHKAKDDTAFATITGLAATASTDNVSFDETTKTLTLDAAALGTNTITLTTTTGISGLGSGDGNIDFKLALGDLGTTKAAAANTVDTNDNTKSITVASGTATITGKTLPYYTVATGDKSITYSPAQTGQTLATISGLSSDANTSNVTFKMDGTTQTGTIVLGKAALGNSRITLVNGSVGNVAALGLKLAFDESDSTYNATNKTLGFEDSGDYWKVTNGKATYQHNTKEGWTLGTGNVVITYKDDGAAEEWLSLDNLSITSPSGTLVTGETEKYSSLNGITIDRNTGTLVISSDLLQAEASKEVTLPAGYTVQIKEGANGTAGSSVGFGTHEDSPYWRVDGTTAYLQYDTDGGWKVENGKITYTEAKTGTTGTVLATITGLNNESLTSSIDKHKFPGTTEVNDCYDTLNGITFNKTTGVITIDSNALTATNNAKAELTLGTGVAAGTYKLALGTGTDITGVENKIGFTLTDAGGTKTATVKEERVAGYVLGDSDTTLTYKEAVDNTLATITGLAGGVKYQTGDSGTTLPKALYVDATGGNFTEVVTLDTTNKTVTLKEDALSKTVGTTIQNTVTNSEYKLAIDGATNNKLGFDNEDGTTKSWHHVNVVASASTPASTTAKYQYTVGEGWTLAANGKSITYKAATTADGTDTTAPTVLVQITGLKASLTDTDLAAIGAPTLDSTTGFYTVTLPTDVLPENTNQVASSENNYILAIDGATNGEYGFGNSGGYWELEKVTTSGNYENTITATYKCDYYKGWKVEDGKIKYTAETTKKLAKIEGLNGGFMTIEAGKKYPTIAGITVDGDTFKLKQDVLGTSASAPVKVTKLTGADSSTSYKLAFADETNTDGSLGFVDSTPTWSINDTTAHYTYKTGQGWKLESNGTISYTAETAAKIRASVTGLKNDGNLLTNIKAGGITVSTDSPSAEQPGVLTLKKSVLNETNSQAVTVSEGDYTLAVDAGNTIDSATHTTALNFDAAASGTVTVKETLGAGWLSSNNDKTLTYYSAVDKELATITGLKAGVTASDFTFDATGKKVSVAASALTDKNVTIAKGSGETQSALQYTLALKDSTVTHDSKAAFGFANEDGAEKYFAVDGTTSTTVNYQHNVGEGWYLDGTQIKYVKPQQPTPENGDPTKYASPVVDVKITGLKSNLTDAEIAAGIKVGADGKTITVSKDVLGTTTTTLTDNSQSTYTLALKDAVDNTVGFADGSAYWKVTPDDTSGNTGKYKATYMYDTAEGWTINSDTITYTALTPKTVLTLTGLKTATGTAREGGTTGEYSALNGIEVTADGKVKLSNSVLGNSNVTLAKVTGDDLNKLNATYKAATYSLALADDTGSANGNDDVTANDGKVGFVPKADKWVADSTAGTYKYQHEIGAGWSLSGTSKIVYTASSDNATNDDINPVTLATVSNLKSGLTVNTNDGTIDGIEVGDDGTITIATSILTTNASASTKLTLGKEDDNTTNLAAGTYKLAIAGDGEGDDVKDGKVGFAQSDPYLHAVSGTVTYQFDTDEGWTLNDVATEIAYSASKVAGGNDANKTKSTVLAKITGLSTGLNAVNGAIDGITVGSDGTFTIGSMNVFAQPASGATSTAVNLSTSAADGTYKLALGSDIATVAHVIDGSASTVTVSGGSATIKGTTEQYAKLNSDTSITYYAQQTDVPLATISGLKSDVNVGVSVAGGVITIDNRALNQTKVSLSIEDITDNEDFTFDLSDDSTNGVAQTANQLTGASSIGDIKNGVATIKQNTAAYYSVGQDGKSVNYNASASKTIAEITGLSSTAASGNVQLSGTTITLGASALGKGTIALVNKKVGNVSDHGLSLKLGGDNGTGDDGTPANDNKFGFKEDTNGKWTIKDGVATYTLDTAEGWTLDTDANVIGYTPKTTAELAVVRGLKSGVKVKDDGSIDGITVTPPTSPSTTTTFSIAESLLGTAAVTLTDLDANDGKEFAFKLKTSNGGDSTSLGFTGNDGASAYWKIEDGTASYQYDVKEGWTVESDGSISYTAAETKTVFTVDGLKGIKNGTYSTAEQKTALQTAGLSLNSKAVELDTAVLGDNELTLTMGAGESGYTLALADDTGSGGGNNDVNSGDGQVGGVSVSAAWFLDSEGNAVYNKTKGATWRLGSGSTSILYTAAETYDQKPLVTIAGLKSGVTATDLNNYIGVSGSVVTLHKEILGTTEVTFTPSKDTNGAAKYTLALGGDVEGSTTTEYWTGKNGTLTLKQDASEGWSLSGTNTVKYTGKKTGATLATLTGLNKTLLPSNGGDPDTPAHVDGIAVSDSNILISDAALTTGNVSIKQGKDTAGTATNYSLVYNGSTSAGTAADANWLVAGGTATLKELTPAYYDVDNNIIKYHVPVAEKDDKRKDIVYAVVKGISKTATKEDIGVTTAYTTSGNTLTKGVITVKPDALNRTNITISGNYYTLATDGEISEPDVTKSAWTLNKTTATMKGDISAGYRASTDGKTIVYSKPQTNATLLTISGLPSTGISVQNNMIKVTQSDGTLTNAFTITNGNIVNMNANVLAKAPAKIVLKGTGYEFAALDANSYTADGAAYKNTNVYTAANAVVAGADTNNDGTLETQPGVDVWRVSGTKAVYKRVIPAHYKLTGTNTLVYVKETDYKDPTTKKAVTYATVTGLVKGLKVSEDGQTVLGTDGTTTAIDITSGAIDIKEAAVGTTAVTYTPGNTSTLVGTSTNVSLNETGTFFKTNETSDTTGAAWLAGGTTATLRSAITLPGWKRTTNSKTNAITFTKQATAKAASGSTVLATVTGLKKGMTAEADATVKGITVSGSTITLDNRVLPTTGTVKKTQVKLNNGKDQTYTLGIDTTGSYPVAETGNSVSNNVWSVSGTNVYYKPSTNATWSLDKTTDGTVKNTLTLQSKETTTSGVTISGLKKGLKLNADGGIDGISLNGTTITLDSRVLGTGNVSVSGGYTLALESTGTYAVPASTVTGVWSVSNSKAVLKEVTSAGWTVKDGKVVYTKAATSSAKATIDGLKSGFKAVNGKIDGIDDTGIYDATGKINSGSTIALSGTILDNKTVKISGSSNLTLKLAEADKTELASTANGGTTWTVSGTTAILKKANTVGYTVDAEGKATDNGGKTLTYNNGTTAGSTTVLSITGLKKGIKASNGEIAGITYKAAESPATGGTFTLDSRALGTTDAKLTKATGVTDDYALALQTDASKDYAVVDSAQGVKFTVENSGIITVSNGYTPVGYSLSGTDTIKYNKTASTSSTAANFATLSGLKSGLKANANGQIAGITYTEVTEGGNTKGTFTLSKDVLGTDTVTLTDKDTSDNTTYKLALDGITSPQAATTSWAVNGNAAVLTITSEGGYTLGDSDTKVVYTPKGTSKVVVGGLSTISGLTQNLATKTITVNDSALSGLTEGKKVTVSDGYTLQLETAPASTGWVVSGNTASYVQTAAANKYLCDGNTITKVGNNGGSQVLATISGLPDNFDANNNATVANGVITLKDAAFENNTSDITLTGSGYTLAIASDATHGNKQAALTDAAWSVAEETVTKNKVKVTTATATLSKGTPSYYKPSADGKTLTYQPFATSGTATAKITGLKAGIKASAVDTATNSTTNIITLTKDMLGDSNVSLTGAGYKLALGADVLNKDNAGTEEVWTLKGTTLTINSTPDTYYTANAAGTAITTTVGTATKLATITGLAKDLTLNSSGTLDGVTIDETNKTIKLSQAVLGTGKTTLTANGYTLVMGSDVAEPRTEDYTWSIKGTTATLTANVSDGYKLTNTSKEKSIAYTAETTPVAATITGLKSGLTAADGSIEGIEFDGETITVSEDVLGTGTLTLTNKGTEQFKLALDATVADDTDADIINGEDVWDYDAKTFKATYKHVTPAHYKLSGNTITYVAQSAGTGIATLTGVSQFADEMFDETDKTVTIFANDVRGSDISISGEGYSLELDPQVSNPVVSEATWTQKSNTITLAGKREAGYSQTSDTLIKYSTADTKENFASIVGATGTFEKSDYVNLEQERVVLYKADLDENSVNVSGTFLLDFQGYENASITGTANAEKIAVDGTGLTVAAGGGNDYIDLGLQGGNTVVYGGGNDVIANFTATGNNQDTLIIDSKTVTKAIYDDGDALLTLNDGSKITLKDFGADTITYLDKNKVATTKSIEAADLMTSDNFIGMEDDLGAITSSGALGDLTDTQAFSGSDDLTTLTKQSTPVTFGSNKK